MISYNKVTGKTQTLVPTISSTNISGSSYLQRFQLRLPLSSVVSLRSRCRPSESDQTFRPPCRSASIGGFEEGSRTHSVDILDWPFRTCRGTSSTTRLHPFAATPQVRAQSSLCLRKRVVLSAPRSSLFSLLYLHQVSSSS
jgi:hypothetical protein